MIQNMSTKTWKKLLLRFLRTLRLADVYKYYLNCLARSCITIYKKEVYVYHNKGNDLPDESLWQVATQTARDTPMQRNLKDCGVLQCMTMSYLCENLPFNFDDTNCSLFRKKMAVALMKNSIEIE
jgi:hypothetical protein